MADGKVCERSAGLDQVLWRRKAKVIEKEKHRTLKACGLWEQGRIR